MLSKKQKDFLETLRSVMGVTSVALQQSGVTYDEYEVWKENIFFTEEIERIKETSLDYVENQLFKQIREGNTNAITFYLKTKGKKRGY